MGILNATSAVLRGNKRRAAIEDSSVDNYDPRQDIPDSNPF